MLRPVPSSRSSSSGSARLVASVAWARTVEVWVPATGQYGTGSVVAPGLVLTAEHVIAEHGDADGRTREGTPAACPSCGNDSACRHSAYRRRLADAGGRRADRRHH